jgi:hypothetical protein
MKKHDPPEKENREVHFCASRFLRFSFSAFRTSKNASSSKLFILFHPTFDILMITPGDFRPVTPG